MKRIINNCMCHKYFVLAVLVFLLYSALMLHCGTDKLKSAYNVFPDTSMVEILRKGIDFCNRLEKDSLNATYERNQDFYYEIKVDISNLLVRAKMISENEMTVKEIENLIRIINTLENMHKKGLEKKKLIPLRYAFIATCSIIMQLEIIKKMCQ